MSFLCDVVTYLSFRNDCLFGIKKRNVGEVIDKIVTHVYLWCNARSEKNINWIDWVQNLIIAIS